MKIEQLQKFCSKDETRSNIASPWTDREGFTWATDGRILIRVPAVEGVEIPEREPASAAAVWKSFNAEARFATLPKFPDVKWEKCYECEGMGEGEEWKCEECDGIGKVEKHQQLRFGKRYFNVRYLRLIAKLPGAKLQHDGDKFSVASFIFDGGQGLLMPMRTE